MKNRSLTTKITLLLGSVAIAGAIIAGCNRNAASTRNASAKNQSLAEQSFVAPGKLDDYYLFYSGGHSGQVYVAGVPSMRHISTIPVFAPYPATGYGFDEESKHMLGGFTWGDVHHPALSQSSSKYDGRWLFVNDNANNRVARIDLRDFKTKQILGPIPNCSGSHASSFVTENTEYLFVSSRFSIPLPKGRVADPKDYAKEYNGVISAISVDPKSGEMKVAWQVLMPPFNFDLASTGKGPSSGWVFFTSYNSEMAGDVLEVNSTQGDKDLGVALNWKAVAAAAAAGKGEMMDGVRVLKAADVTGSVFLLPIGKSPHGMDVDPTGQWIVAGGKLQPTATVYNMSKIKTAIETKNFTGENAGFPILRYDAVMEGEVPVGLGPLHTQYDGRGYAYTSLYVESTVAKWKLPPWTDEERKKLDKIVVDKIDVHFNIGHLVAGASDTDKPYGTYLVAMNKLSKGRHLSVGPAQPESSQLIDISGPKMVMVAEAFTEPEPHFAQLVKADVIKSIEVYPKDENKNPDAVWEMAKAGSKREGKTVTVSMIGVRSRFIPEKIEAEVGDELIVHLTNIEQVSDMIHGFAIAEHNLNIVIDPGETKTARIKLTKAGVFPFYCTNFCSALHQEMQGNLVVKPATVAMSSKP